METGSAWQGRFESIISSLIIFWAGCWYLCSSNLAVKWNISSGSLQADRSQDLVIHVNQIRGVKMKLWESRCVLMSINIRENSVSLFFLTYVSLQSCKMWENSQDVSMCECGELCSQKRPGWWNHLGLALHDRLTHLHLTFSSRAAACGRCRSKKKICLVLGEKQN